MANNWKKSIKGTIKASKNAPETSVAIHNRAKQLALKYYGTTDLKALSTYQLDKVISWTTGKNPDAGRNRDRKAGRSKGRYAKGNL